MNYAVVEPPAEDAVVTLEKAKQHLKVEDDDEDVLIAAYIAAAVGHLDGPEGWLGRALGIQTIEVRLHNFDCGSIRLRFPPVRSIESVEYVDTAGEVQTIDPADYELFNRSLVPAFGKAWPMHRLTGDAVRIRYRAGYDDGMRMPPAVIAAVLLMVGDLYRNRESTSEGAAIKVNMPTTVENLLEPLRKFD